MKRNKLAAGALALALGFGAVAPSFAAESTTTKNVVSAKSMFQEKYAQELKKAQELHADATAKKSRLDKAEVAKKEAEDRVVAAARYSDIKVSSSGDAVLETELDQARKALGLLSVQGYNFIKANETDKTTVVPFNKVVVTGDAVKGYSLRLVSDSETVVTKEPTSKTLLTVVKDIPAEAARYTEAPNPNFNPAETSNTKNAFFRYLADTSKGSDYYTRDGVAVTNNANNAKSLLLTSAKVAGTEEQTKREFDAAYERYANAWRTWNKTITNRVSEKNAAYQELLAAERAYDVAVTEYKNAKAAADPAVVLYEDALAKLKAAADSYNVVLVATNNGIEVRELGSQTSKVSIADLEKSVAKAKETLRAVELLKQYAGNTAKKTWVN